MNNPIPLQHYGIGKRYEAASLSDLIGSTEPQKRAFKTVSDYAHAIKKNYKAGKGLVLIGNVDTGKTMISSLIIKRAVESNNGFSRLTTEVDLLIDIARADNYSNNITQKEIVEKYVNQHFLAIDDVGVESLTSKQKARLYAVVNGRYASGKPTIVSSNLDKKNLELHLGKRIYSRLTSRTKSEVIEFNWAPFSEAV